MRTWGHALRTDGDGALLELALLRDGVPTTWRVAPGAPGAACVRGAAHFLLELAAGIAEGEDVAEEDLPGFLAAVATAAAALGALQRHRNGVAAGTCGAPPTTRRGGGSDADCK